MAPFLKETFVLRTTYRRYRTVQRGQGRNCAMKYQVFLRALFLRTNSKIVNENSKDLGGCIFKLLLLELIGDAIELEVDKCFNDIGKKPKKYESSILLLCTVYLLHL